MNTKPYNKEDYTVPFYDTFPQFLDGIDQTYGSRPALSWFSRRKEESTLTYRQMVQLVRDLRRALVSKGLAPGAHVAIVSENSADWIISFLAIVSCGAVAVCVDTEQSDENIRDMVVRSQARLLFLSPTFLPICIPLLNDGHADRAVLMGGLASDERVVGIQELYELGSSLQDLPQPQFSVSQEQTAEIVFTSGTTSQSKMVMLSQKAVMQNLCDSSQYVCFYDRVFCSLPFYHAYGLNCAVLNSFLRGCHLYINGDLKPPCGTCTSPAPTPCSPSPLWWRPFTTSCG